ncbi:hypothetical protein BH11PLA2_BH11PLA2_35880 [soil metagenome]
MHKSLAYVMTWILCTLSPLTAETFTVTLKVTSADGKPVAKAEAEVFWNASGGFMRAFPTTTDKFVTDATGKVEVRIKTGHEKRPLLVMSEDRTLGAFVTTAKSDAGNELAVTLGPTVKVKGQLKITELNRKPETSYTSIVLDGADGIHSHYRAKDGTFEFTMPAGKYKLEVDATDAKRLTQAVVLDTNRSEFDLGIIALQASTMAKLVGKPAPTWSITAARGVSEKATLADYKGKWVYLEFWGYWCEPCCYGALPELIGLYEDHADHRDKFEVFAIHNKDVKSFAELDKHLPAIRKAAWHGKDLPFPILLDTKNETVKLYEPRGYPTGLLIDPDGKFVGETSLKDFEAKLPPVSAAKKWARYYDMHNNYMIENKPNTDTFQNVFGLFTMHTGVKIDVDAAALKAAGLKPDQVLPGALVGSSITNRTVVEIYLQPFGLGVVPSADGKTLRITTKTSAVTAAVPSRDNNEADIAKRLKIQTPKTEPATPLKFNSAPLYESLLRFSEEYNLPVALEAKAMQSGTLDPAAKVSGELNPNDLGVGLLALLRPLGLLYSVKYEVILIHPAAK